MDIKLKDGKHFDVTKRIDEWHPPITARLKAFFGEAFMITGTFYFTVRLIEIYFHW